MKDKVTCVVVDDDPHAIEILEDHISRIPTLALRISYTDPVQALIELIVGPPVDLLFLDIDMPGANGFKFAERLKEIAPNVIFTTGHVHYGPQAFKVRAKHFLLKPIDITDFAEAVAVVLSAIAIGQPSPVADDTIFLRTGLKNVRIKLRKREIYLLESASNYVNIITVDTTHMVYMTMKEMAEILKDDINFYQIRKSAIVNADHVNKIDGNTVIFYNINNRVVMSALYKNAFLDYMNGRTLISKRS